MNETNQFSNSGHGRDRIEVSEIDALAAFDTPTIANALEVLGVSEVQWLGPRVRAVIPVSRPLVGVAVTATMNEQRGGKFDHLQGWLQFLEAIEKAHWPVVAVFQDTSQEPGREAVIGEGMSLVMRAVGAVGAITNGCIRDVAALGLMNFPVLARGSVVARGAIRFHLHQVPVQVGGMKVLPWDIIHADENGALVIPASQVTAVLETVTQVLTKEKNLFGMFTDRSFSVAKLREWYRVALETASTEKNEIGEHG